MEEEHKGENVDFSINGIEKVNFIESDYIDYIEFKHYVTSEISILKRSIENIDFNLIP